MLMTIVHTRDLTDYDQKQHNLFALPSSSVNLVKAKRLKNEQVRLAGRLGFRVLYVCKLVLLMKEVYANGPEILHYYGFWNGRPREEICASLTHVDAQHWVANPDKCEQRIQKQVNGLLICVLCVLAVVLGYKYMLF